MRYNVIDIFCGCGGFSLGFLKEGFNVLLGLDNDYAALESYAQNHKNAKTLNCDITKVFYDADIKDILGLKKIDVIIGGPPCKGMRLSGDKGLETSENSLYLHYIRLVTEIEPRAFVIENIPDIIYNSGGMVKDAIIKYFRDYGYAVKCFLLSSADFGVAQTRDRAIFIGVKAKKNPVLFKKKLDSKITCKEALSDLPFLSPKSTIPAYGYRCEPKSEYQKLMRLDSATPSNHYFSSNTGSISRFDVNYQQMKLKADEIAPSIDTRPKYRNQLHYEFDRLLSVRECARLQSFPDNFTFCGNEKEQFAQVGNAIPPILAQNIAENLKTYLLHLSD